MKQNINLYIGDNASGKTRVLKNVIKDAKKHNKAVVTNLPEYKLSYVPDKDKKGILENSNNRLVDRLVFDREIETLYESAVEQLLTLVYAKGDILVLDELDALLTAQDVINVATAIADTRHKWEGIYLNGYSNDILRVFVDTDYDTYKEEYNPNVFWVDDKMTIHPIAEEDTYEYFDKIRG